MGWITCLYLHAEAFTYYSKLQRKNKPSFLWVFVFFHAQKTLPEESAWLSLFWWKNLSFSHNYVRYFSAKKNMRQTKSKIVHFFWFSSQLSGDGCHSMILCSRFLNSIDHYLSWCFLIFTKTQLISPYAIVIWQPNPESRSRKNGTERGPLSHSN